MKDKLNDDDIIIESPPLEEILESNGIDTGGTKELILMNDDHNSFTSAVLAIIEICGHTEQRAIELALLAHTKGSVAVLEGQPDLMVIKRSEFHLRGFDAKLT